MRAAIKDKLDPLQEASRAYNAEYEDLQRKLEKVTRSLTNPL
jgi:hypothetical protein